MCILDIIRDMVTGAFVLGVFGSGIAFLVGGILLVVYLMRISIGYSILAIPVLLYILWFAGKKGNQ